MGQRDPSAIYPFNLLDLAATAWAAPNLPLFPGALGPTSAPVSVSAPAAGAPPWLRPLHEIQQGALSLNPSDPASSGDTAASPWTSSDWSATPRIPAAAPSYADRNAANPYLGSAADAGELDPARTRRLLAEAKRAYDFATWISGDRSIGSSLPIGYVAAATDALRPSTPSARSDERFDSAAGAQPLQNQLAPMGNALFVRSSGWPFPRAPMDPAVPPMIVAASDQAPARSSWGFGPPLSDFAPYSAENQQRGRATYKVIQDPLDALGVYLRRGGSALRGNDDYNRCMRAANGSTEDWVSFCDSMLFGLRGNVAGNDSAWQECREKDYESKQMKENWCRNQFGGE